MPLMTHPKSGQSRIVPGRSRSAYEQRGWTVASDEPAPAPVAAPGPPTVDDRKADWVAYAESLGIDPDGLTKAELIAVCGDG